MSGAASAIADVQSRIAEIQSRFAPAPQQASSTGFASTLESILGASATGASGATGEAVVESARKYLGVPYVYGGNDPAKGLDCSSLVQRAYKDLGIDMPRVAADQAKMGTPVSSLAQAKPGDLVAFGSPVDHIGIYVGDNKMIVAPRTGDVVKIQEVYKAPTAIRRIIPDTPAISSAFASYGAAGLATNGIASNLHSQYDSLFVKAAGDHGVPANLLAAVAKQESGFNPKAGSGAGAQGLMQFMPATAKGLNVNPWDPASSVDGAARMLKGLKERFGSWDLALAGYNAGSGNVQKYGGIPPFKETQNYVKNVLSMAQLGGAR